MNKAKAITLQPEHQISLREDANPDDILLISYLGKLAFKIKANSFREQIATYISNSIQDVVPINSAATGFIKRKSYLDFLSPHRRSSFFIRLDVKDFFHSIREEDIKKSLSNYILPSHIMIDDKKTPTIDLLIKYVMHEIPDDFPDESLKGKKILPIGFPSSPSISNLVFRKIDILISKYCQHENIIYTRYADDLLFSSEKKLPPELENKVSEYLSILSLKKNNKKTLCTKSHISINGYVIDGEKNSIRLSNHKLQRINKLTHAIINRKDSPREIMKVMYGKTFSQYPFNYTNGKGNFYKKYCIDQIDNKLKGYRSYLLSIIKYDNNQAIITSTYKEKIMTVITRIEKCIDIYHQLK
ncbi:reverse transcriptase family protein [Aeromonas veronii]